MSSVGRSTWNSVDPNPMSLINAGTTATLPFSIHGVIFANKTSPSRNAVNPFFTSLANRAADTSISPLAAPTADIGTNETGRSSGMSFLSSRGLTAATSSIFLVIQPSVRLETTSSTLSADRFTPPTPHSAHPKSPAALPQTTDTPSPNRPQPKTAHSQNHPYRYSDSPRNDPGSYRAICVVPR